ncbi:MAG TPA: hypothetical protein PLV87_10600, partial [Opitutaceae bacterium]|nr:hypothetical protein [Opitutaceae bacterium]
MTYHKAISLRRVFFTAACSLLSFATAAWAQRVSDASAATPSDDVIELSKFEVSSTANRGYVTTSSMSASRIAVPITEL